MASSDTKALGRLVDKLGLETIHDDVPNFEFTNSKSEVLNASAFRSKILVLHFWATWCESCKKELPQLVELQKAMKDAEFLPLSSDDPTAPSRVQNFMQSTKLQMPSDILTTNPENKKFIAWGIPMTYFISKNRKVFLRAKGARDWSRISAEDLQKLAHLLK